MIQSDAGRFSGELKSMAQSTTATRPIPLDEPFRTTRIQLGSCLIGEYIDHPSGVTAEVLNRCHGEHVAGRIL